MTDDFFKPEDFLADCGTLTPFGMAERANAKLKKHIEGLPVVFSLADKGCWYTHSGPTNVYGENQVAYKARLICIEEIKKKTCDHEPIFAGDKHYIHECKHCGKALKAEWREA